MEYTKTLQQSSGFVFDLVKTRFAYHLLCAVEQRKAEVHSSRGAPSLERCKKCNDCRDSIISYTKKSPCCCWPGCRSLMLRKGRAKVARQAGCDPESLRVPPANCSLYLLVTSSESTPNLCHFHVPCDKMHSNLILACSCFVATWDLFCLGDTSDNCFVSGLPCLIFSWNWRLFFLFLLFAQSLNYLGLTRGLVRKFHVHF